ncbi:FadR/GntR family transcriptional regulator [Oceanobacillus alkalisoli]|uniref:FadR/GntR family transcriptional regulator n=1 Tax=Oceanobacillus alkalisoli TaxID=2925113 RepID=UPI001EF0584D|nr:GntR family transcriptional regulator [Oceanobacillus alkalisoli]MCF3943353.1 GntR family transcriptional regulator [Oceanobacillus alkalisoli]MCG5105294.1 GntR family transcriptional regulator [Oceanobacillus alkalisoli]
MFKVSNSSKPKVYQGVLEELRAYIKDNHLLPGDKLPSERELADKLQAGRSSIREALRALELLGLIETRRGEGTFLRTYQSLQSVELLSSFILLADRTKDELLQVKAMIEKEAVKLACPKLDETALLELDASVSKEITREEKHMIFFSYLFKKANNQLLLKIWMMLEEFSSSLPVAYYGKTFYNQLMELLSKKDCYAIEALFEQQDHQLYD